MNSSPFRDGARARWLRLLLGALALSTLVAGGGLRQDELDCEDAVARLQSCCPGFADATITCVASEGCGVSEPALSIAESQCIVARSCADLVESGICAATHDLQSPDQGDDGNFVSRPEVCR